MNQPQVITRTINDAIRLLNASGATYKVISPNGEEFGALQVIVPSSRKKRQMNPDRKMGEVRDHYIKYININAKVGDVFLIPRGKYSCEEIRSGVAAKLSTLWGKKTYTTCIDGDNIQVLRTSEKEPSWALI